MSQELEKLGLSANVRNALVAAGLDTPEKLIEYKIDNPFSAIANIGDAGQREIEQALAAAGGGGGDDDAETGGDDETDAAETVLNPDEPGISPGERGRRHAQIKRAEADAAAATHPAGALPVVDKVTAAGVIVSRKTAFVRGGETFTPPGNDDGETVIAAVELYGECDANFFADAIAGGSASIDDVSSIEVDDKGNRISPAEYVVRLKQAGRVGNSRRGQGHKLATMTIGNYRIPPHDIAALMRTRTAVFEPLKPRGRKK